MKILKHNIILPYHKVLSWIFSILTIISIMYFWSTDFSKYDDPEKAMTFSGGLCVALIVATLQLLITILEQKEISHFRRTGILEVLKSRDDKAKYRELIESSQSRIDIMGSTCSRLLEDFGRVDFPSARTLVDALERQVLVRLLVSRPENLEKTDQDRLQNTTVPRACELLMQHPKCFQIRYLDSSAAHNLGIFDNTCVFGPIFQGLPSKDTPAIVARTWSVPAASYIKHFEQQWEKGHTFE